MLGSSQHKRSQTAVYEGRSKSVALTFHSVKYYFFDRIESGVFLVRNFELHDRRRGKLVSFEYLLKHARLNVTSSFNLFCRWRCPSFDPFAAAAAARLDIFWLLVNNFELVTISLQYFQSYFFNILILFYEQNAQLVLTPFNKKIISPASAEHIFCKMYTIVERTLIIDFTEYLIMFFWKCCLRFRNELTIL